MAYVSKKCEKCGRSGKEPGIKLSRFPKPGVRNTLRCEMWAKFCFPNSPWSSPDFQQKLYSKNKMICSEDQEIAFNKYMGTSLSHSTVHVDSQPGPSLFENFTTMALLHSRGSSGTSSCCAPAPTRRPLPYSSDEDSLASDHGDSEQCVVGKADDGSNGDDPLYEEVPIEHHEMQDDIQEITEVIKIEPPDMDLPVEFDTPAAPPEDVDTILGSDDGADKGFSPFVRPSSTHKLPVINMFAVMEFVATNNHYSTLDYRKLKELVTRKGHDMLLSNLRVQNREGVHRIRGTVHLQTSSQCALEYDVDTHTVTRSECMACPLATCPHVAALLMWLHAAANHLKYCLKNVPDDDDTSTGTTKRGRAKPGGNTKVAVKPKSQPAVPVQTGAPGLGHPAAGAPGLGRHADEDEAQLVDDVKPGPSTAKRKKMPLPKVTPSYTARISKTKSVPKMIDDNTDDSIKCSFTRKCFFDVWRSSSGSFTERVAHTRTIMTEAFRDPEYVIDFQPLERRLELLCTEVEGYWNAEANKESFDSKYLEWLAVTEYIEMKKQKRGIDPGSSEVFRGGVLARKSHF